jgi:hypothetical protein
MSKGSIRDYVLTRGKFAEELAKSIGLTNLQTLDVSFEDGIVITASWMPTREQLGMLGRAIAAGENLANSPDVRHYITFFDEDRIERSIEVTPMDMVSE